MEKPGDSLFRLEKSSFKKAGGHHLFATAMRILYLLVEGFTADGTKFTVREE
jgi:hypothetical protein